MRWMNKLTPQAGGAGAGSRLKETTCQSKKGTDLEIIENLKRIRSSM